MLLDVHRNRRYIRDGREPRTATSTFTQLLSSVSFESRWVSFFFISGADAPLVYVRAFGGH